EPRPRATGSPSPSASPGARTGSVTPEPAPRRVACGAEAPPLAGEPKPQFAGPPPEVIDPGRRYTAIIETSCGEIVVELLADRAPETVNSFVFLARQGFFDGTYVHRLDASIDVIQAGDPTGTGSGGPGYAIPDELTGREEYGPGTVAMANSGPNTGGSQFFIIAGPDGHRLDDNPAYTIFGRVVRGMEVAERILALPVRDPEAARAGDLSAQQPKLAVYIERVLVRQR
ncbi:MAG TPA: peptidylprolyl isomerase, partial [Actinomycetota bacterium]|nr:peptidylprolyl isomerase [Actinomycetota bacterium]